MVHVPADTCTTFYVAKIHARMIKFHQLFFYSIPFEKVTLERFRLNKQNYNNINGIVMKLTRFQINPETEVACKALKPIFKIQYSKILEEYENFGINKLESHWIQ